MLLHQHMLLLMKFLVLGISARGALIYNSTQGDKSVAVLDFGDTKTTNDQTLSIEFPTANSSSAIIRIE